MTHTAGAIAADHGRPLEPARARSIARAFAPAHPLGNRHDYYYTLIKLRSDPLYPGVLAALRGTREPVLDLGCGLGLLAHALRQDGQSMPYYGVDIDADKIGRGRRVAARSGLADVHFDVVDLARTTPSHAGSVAILDVLQYLQQPAQQALLSTVGAMLTPGARLVIRTGLSEESRRGRTTRIADRLASLVGWMQERARCYPTRDGLEAMLATAGLRATFAPLYGNTPFNNWLVVAERAGDTAAP
ncbi:methyltransferase domain-containing protein [Luteimonas sp. YGD11-2]|uniref:methyltransferase domain-containing protein n=1 Tax=Luteimonas sp. YGD11-2 TaxID=2508168 RepID=UPI000C23B2C4|nr:methyltransferase domain-containing protein [Luteimonas sp. YGD11-2]PJJ96761.1 SAM-dependent methyltransferase [Xanthomonadaceae bacterium NML91-0213]